MRLMKNSGIEWIGDIPSDFEMIKIKYIINIEKGKLPQNTNTEGLGEIYVGASEINGKTPSLYTTDDLLKCKEDDILLLWDGANAGLIANGLCGVVSSTVARCRVNSSRYHPQYIYYTLKNAERYYKDKVTGTTIPHMSSKYIDDTYILNLSFSEQKKIADFLDEKCVEIDTVIEKTKVTIEEYKKLKQSVITQAVTKGIRPNRPMKDSKNIWFGNIPFDWEIQKIKYVFTIKKDIAGEEGYTVLSITQRGIMPKDLSKNEGQLAENYSKYQLVNIGDFAMNHMDLLTGWVDISKFSGVTSPDYRVFMLNDKNKNSDIFYLYLMQMCYFNRIFYGLGQGVSGMGRWRLQADKFLNFTIPVPPTAEQKEIADYLDKKCSEIDELITKKTSLLSELESYKKSLIYEYVTGKKEVK